MPCNYKYYAFVIYQISMVKIYFFISKWDSDNLIVLETSVVGGVLRCSIDRKINGEGLFKLSRKWFILHAIGVVSGKAVVLF